VYGVREDGHAATDIDVGYPQSDISKEWIEQVINSNIQRRVDGIRINPVQLGASAVGNVLYVVSIPQSLRAPHMAWDKRFYKRFNFVSVPMEEYEVRDVSRRNQAPDLKLTLQWQAPVGRLPPMLELVALISNDALEVAAHATINLYLDPRVTIISSIGMAGPFNHLLSRVNDTFPVPVMLLSQNWSTPMKLPIWQGESFSLTDTPLVFELPPSPGEYVFGWRLSSPRMNRKQRFYSVTSDGSNLTVVEHA
jgi:hypothetical protein